MSKKHRVINFSGGGTSAYMTIKYYKQGDIVLFQDTGREHPMTYKFLDDFEKYEGIPIIRIKAYETDDPFRTMLEAKKFSGLPNMMKRFCTDTLKIRTAKRWLRQQGITEFENMIGFRADEPQRVLKRKQKFKRVKDIFPLYDDGITKEMINAYWASKPYKLEMPKILGNCTLCFMKGQNAILAILREFPELADKWIEDEEMSQKNGYNRTYFKGIKIKQLKAMAQNNLFKSVGLDNINPAFNCECGA